MKKAFFLFILFFIFLVLWNIDYVHSIGIQQPDAATRLIIFQPGLEKEYSFALVNAQWIHSYVFTQYEELYQYVELHDEAQDTGPRIISATIRFPQTLKSGKYEIFIGGKEISDSRATVSAVAAIQSRITIISLYEGKNPEFSFSGTDMPVNGSGNFTVSIENFGKERIDDAYAIIEVYDPYGNFVTTLNTDHKPVEPKLDGSQQPVVLNVLFNSKLYDLKPGIYNATARLMYDGIEYPDKKQINFRIGSLMVKVVDWTKSVFINATNKFRIVIESDWVSQIDDVYARITTPNHGIIKTPNLDLSRFQTATLETYWETDKLELKEYDLPIELFFDKTSATTVVQVNMTEGKPPVEEKPKSNFNISISPTMWVLVALVILLIVNLYYLVIRKKPIESQPKAEYKQDLLKPPKF